LRAREPGGIQMDHDLARAAIALQKKAA